MPAQPWLRPPREPRYARTVPGTLRPADDVTFLTWGPAEAVQIALAAADGKNLEVFSPTIGRQLLGLGLIDEIDLHIVPVLLGDGIRLYDNPGGE